MSLRSGVLNLVEIVLRVPPLFLIDEILKIGLGLSEELSISEPDSEIEEITANFTNATTNESSSEVYSFLFITLLRLLFSAVGCAGGICLFILSTKHLMVVYMYLMSIIVVYLSYWINVTTITTLTSGSDSFTEQLLYYFPQIVMMHVAQLMLAFVFTNVHLGPRHQLVDKVLPFAFLTPAFVCFLPVPFSVMKIMPFVASLLPWYLVNVVLFTSTVSVIQSIYSGYIQSRNYVSNFGISALVESEWIRLNVPEVLRTFWMLRVLEHAGIFYLSGYWDIDDGYSPYYRLLKYLMVTGCDTLTAVLGITSIVSYICNYIGKFFQWILLTDDENDKNFGTVSAIVFYILALQTGLTSLEPDIRFVRLCRNFCLLFTALLHFTHNVVNPLLMSLSASHNPSLRRHLHALMVCGLLVILPAVLMHFLWATQETSTWLLAVTAFSIEVIVKVFVSLSIYTLFLLDAVREKFWERLDDYIYYIRAFGNTVEFCFGIFLFFNGAWILLFESGSAIRAVMMCIHAYFNIWCDAKAGWSVFIKRRTAVNKIESLPEADKEQLRRLEDVCAICYQEMQSAKITKCKHFFHGVCLRKWLYVQDRCPLCHEILHSVDSEDKKDNSTVAELPDLPIHLENDDER